MTINEIAKMAGVSRATVSRYLNNGYVSDEKKHRIQKVIQITGYKPSTQAQWMRSGKTKQIGVVLPKINSESVGRMVAGISEVLGNEGYQLILGNTNNNEKEELNYLELFKADQVDGIILIGTVLTKQHYQLMNRLKIPIVVLGQKAKGFSCVYQDDYNASKDLTELLLKAGKRIGYIGVTTRDRAAGHDRLQGFLDAIEQYKRQCLQEQSSNVCFFEKKDMREAQFQIESGYGQMEKLLQQDAEIDSVFCATDSIAVGAMMYLKKQGICVPDRIQVAGVGDNTMGHVGYVELTTVHFYYKTSGKEAANMLLGILKNGEDIQRQVKMGYKVIANESTR